jgi:hypothetical protein
VVKDANGQSLAYVYCRENRADAGTAKVLTMDEARRICRLLILLDKNPAFGSFPLPPYLGTFRKLLWAFFRKLLDASYAALQYPP